MFKARVFLSTILISILLIGCSKEEKPASADNKLESKQPNQKAIAKSTVLPDKAIPKIQTLPEPPALPTRSEVRVLSEETKAIESDAKNVIDQFDANLSNRQLRKDAEAKFQKMLPEYKEKMLSLGKAKLKEAAADAHQN